jgi:glyoxylase-like metal-dependent hydrolase (beta-lactamase superfamily II)
MPLQPIAGRALYLPGSNNLGVIATGDGGAIAVDTGLDKDTGRALRRALDEAGLRLRAIISTHHHADHVGGNDFLLRNLPDVEVWAPPLEAALIAHPILEPVYLSLGARPAAALQTKWLLSKGSPVHHLLAGRSAEVAGVRLDVLPLPGHSIGQVGVAVDGVCFVADGLFGPTVLEKHGIPYAHDVGAQLASLAAIAARDDAFFLPGHGALLPRGELEGALEANREAVERSSEAVMAALDQPGGLDAVAQRVASRLGLTLAGIPQYAIFASAVSAHLTHLEAQGRALLLLEENRLLWMAA